LKKRFNGTLPHYSYYFCSMHAKYTSIQHNTLPGMNKRSHILKMQNAAVIVLKDYSMLVK